MSSAILRLRLQTFIPSRGTVLACACAVGLGIVVALDARVAGLLVAAVLVPVLVWADPRVGFALLALGLGLNVDLIGTPVHVSLPQLVALSLVGSIRLRPGHLSRAGLWGMSGFLFLAAGLPSLLHAVNPGGAVTGMVTLFTTALILASAARWLMGHTDLADGILTLLVCGAVISLVPALLQVAFNVGIPEYRVGGMMRAYSTYGQPNSYGLYLVGVLPVAIGLGLARRSGAMLIAAIAILGCIVLTGSRGAWAGAAMGLLAMYLTTVRLRVRSLVAAIVGASVLVAAVLLIPGEFVLGRLDLTDWSAQQRLLVLFTAWDGIARSPLLGYGPGSFAAMLPSIARRGTTDDVTMPHNLVLDIWFELGLMAVVCFVVLLAGYIITVAGAARRNRDLRLAGLLGGVVAMMVGTMFGSLFIRGVQETFVLLVVTSAALVRGLDSENADASAVPV